ncbi:MAG: hypothetical protein ACI9SP_004110 [Arenicella sp.]|jgi:hypothetical protein
MKIKSILLAFCLLLVACEQATIELKGEPEVSTEQEDQSEVLAKVNGEPITQDDIDFMIQRTFSGSEQLFFNEEMQGKVLESLIASKAMQQKMRATLSEDRLADIKSRTMAFEEELYVKEYLTEFATPEPVSSKMVQDYYQQYPEEFGGGDSIAFEMLATTTKPSADQRDAILAQARVIKDSADWSAFANDNELGLVYKNVVLQSGLLAPELERAVKNTKVGETSDIVLIKGVPHAVRVTSVTTLPAKPLSAVSAQIRKKLAALQLKKSVKAASEAAISEAKVERQ